MENGTNFYNGANYLRPFAAEEVDLNKYFVSTDAITNQAGADAKIREAVKDALLSEINDRMAAIGSFNVKLNGQYRPISFNPDEHTIVFTNLNRSGDGLHLDGVIRLKGALSLKYDLNGAEGKYISPDNALAPEGVVTFTAAAPQLAEGYIFKGWNTRADGSGTTVNVGEEYTITSDTTLYAQWEKPVEKKTTYTIKYVEKDGKPIEGMADVTLEGKVGDVVNAKNYAINRGNYIYIDGDKDITLVEDPEGNVITLVYGTERVYTVTVNYYNLLTGESIHSRTGETRKLASNGIVLGENGEPARIEGDKLIGGIVSPEIEGFFPYHSSTARASLVDAPSVEENSVDLKLHGESYFGLPLGQDLDWDEELNAYKKDKGFVPKSVAILGVGETPSDDYIVNIIYAPYYIKGEEALGTIKPDDEKPTGDDADKDDTNKDEDDKQDGGTPAPGAGTPPTGTPSAPIPAQPSLTPNDSNTVAPIQATAPISNTAVAPVDAQAPVNAQAIDAQTTAPIDAQAQAPLEAQAEADPATPAATAIADVTPVEIVVDSDGTPTLRQVEDVDAALANMELNDHICNIFAFLLLLSTVVTMWLYYSNAKKHNKRIFELRALLGEDDPFRKEK